VVIVSVTIALAHGLIPYSLAWLASIVIGMSFAGLTFLGHETLHGAVVRGARMRKLVGWLGFLPFVISPRLWVAWHNQVHHGNTNRADKDPDAYPTLEVYKQSLAVRVATDFASPGRSKLRGIASLLIGFTVQSSHMLIVASQRGYLSRRAHLAAVAETLAGIAVWTSLALIIPATAFVFAFCLPLLVANAIVMGFILTNHSLSPHTSVNNTLANSLTVTVPRWMEWVTLGFGYHVEHHFFPAMSARHAPSVAAVLRKRWADEYQSMPLWNALAALHRSPRVYHNAETLIDPTTGEEWPTLGETQRAPRQAAQAAIAVQVS
jgi:fatty acid desaturase